MRVRPVAVYLSAVLFTFVASLAADAPNSIVTPRRPVIDTCRGVKVVDDYRCLKDGNGAAVKDWVAAQKP